eukprot:6174730-Pleurochrysis_carterae.AAC.2
MAVVSRGRRRAAGEWCCARPHAGAAPQRGRNGSPVSRQRTDIHGSSCGEHRVHGRRVERMAAFIVRMYVHILKRLEAVLGGGREFNARERRIDECDWDLHAWLCKTGKRE